MLQIFKGRFFPCGSIQPNLLFSFIIALENGITLHTKYLQVFKLEIGKCKAL